MNMPRLHTVAVDKQPRGVHPALVAYGSALHAERRAAGLSQDELAEASGVGQSTISKWERGLAGRSPRVEDIRRIEEALQLTSGRLFVVAGYVKLPTSTVEAIALDPALDRGYRQILIEAYEGAIRSSAARATTPPAKPNARRR